MACSPYPPGAPHPNPFTYYSPTCHDLVLVKTNCNNYADCDACVDAHEARIAAAQAICPP